MSRTLQDPSVLNKLLNLNRASQTSFIPAKMKIKEANPDVIIQKALTADERNQIATRITAERSDLEKAIITGIDINILSESEIKKMSIMEVKSPKKDGFETIFDPKLGPKTTELCVTCGKLYRECSGHFSHIELGVPIANPILIKPFIYVLNSVCWTCSRVYLNKNEFLDHGLPKNGLERLREISKRSVGCCCQYAPEKPTDVPCNQSLTRKIKAAVLKTHGKIEYTTNQGGDDVTAILPIEAAQQIFKTISPTDLAFLGFSKGSSPLNYIITVLPVIPPCDRPNRYDPKTGKSELDSISTDYINIIKASKEYRDATSEVDSTNSLKRIYDLVKSIMYGDDKKVGIIARMSGKMGYVRGANARIVTNFYRSVLSINPNLRFGELSVPFEARSFLPVIVKVTPENIAFLQKMVDNGEVNAVIKNNGAQRGMKINARQGIKLLIGYTVYRWLIDGDLILFNRQPTLSKRSYMGFTVRLWQHSTIGLHPTYTKPFNADFDGDEGTLVSVQSTEGLKDIIANMHIKNCLLSETSNNALGLILDNIAGLLLLSDPKVMVNQETYMNALQLISGDQIGTLDQRLAEFKVPKFSGRALISALFPADFYYNKKGTIINKGILIKGDMSKSQVAEGDNTVIKELYLIDPQLAFDFITEATRVSNLYLMDRPVTMGIADCFVLDKKTDVELEAITQKIDQLNLDVTTLLQTADSDSDVQKLNAEITDVELDAIAQKIDQLNLDVTTLPQTADSDSDVQKLNAEITNLRAQMINVQDTINTSIETALYKMQYYEDLKKTTTNENELRRLEMEIKNVANKSKEIGAKLISSSLKGGNLALAITGGIKGSVLNAAGISGNVGQIIVRGIRPELSDMLFGGDASDALKKGYIIGSFGGRPGIDGRIEGLNPVEVLFSAMGSREGMGGTSLSTPIVGDIGRRLRKLMENLIVCQDGTIRYNNQIVSVAMPFDNAMLSNVDNNVTNVVTTTFINMSDIVAAANLQFGYSGPLLGEVTI